MEGFFSRVRHAEMTQMDFFFGSIILLFVVFLVISWLRRLTERPASPAAFVQSEKAHLKDRYQDEIDSAVLILGITKEKHEFKDLTDVTWDEDTSEVLLSQESNDIQIKVGAYDLLVCKGATESRYFTDTCRVRIWSRGELIHDELISDYSYEPRNVTGYDQLGADVYIVLGSSLTMVAE